MPRFYTDDDDEPNYPDCEDEFAGDDNFADPGGRSALRASSARNPRNLPCPTCERPNLLTPADVARGYQCDGCADRAEGRMGYGGVLTVATLSIGPLRADGKYMVATTYPGAANAFGGSYPSRTFRNLLTHAQVCERVAKHGDERQRAQFPSPKEPSNG